MNILKYTSFIALGGAILSLPLQAGNGFISVPNRGAGIAGAGIVATGSIGIIYTAAEPRPGVMVSVTDVVLSPPPVVSLIDGCFALVFPGAPVVAPVRNTAEERQDEAEPKNLSLRSPSRTQSMEESGEF